MPIFLLWKERILKYWNRLCSEDIPIFLREAASLSLHNATAGKQSWAMNTASIFNHAGYSSSFFEGNGCDRELTNRLMSVYRDQFIQTWNSYLLRNHSIRGNSGNKLRTYRLFKDTFDLEPYLLNVKNTSYRVALTRLRVGSHSLAIEVGRFHKPIPLPINDRLCSICQSVEDELHFL